MPLSVGLVSVAIATCRPPGRKAQLGEKVLSASPCPHGCPLTASTLRIQSPKKPFLIPHCLALKVSGARPHSGGFLPRKTSLSEVQRLPSVLTPWAPRARVVPAQEPMAWVLVLTRPVPSPV